MCIYTSAAPEYCNRYQSRSSQREESVFLSDLQDYLSKTQKTKTPCPRVQSCDRTEPSGSSIPSIAQNTELTKVAMDDGFKTTIRLINGPNSGRTLETKSIKKEAEVELFDYKQDTISYQDIIFQLHEQEQHSDRGLKSFIKDFQAQLSLRYHSPGNTLASESTIAFLNEYAFLGKSLQVEGENVYLNVHEPFCFITVGLQGSGKSHSLATNSHSLCEITGLTSPRPGIGLSLTKEQMIVLVSPSYYLQRKAFYGDNFIVKPLLFKWSSLSANHIKKLMRVNDDDNQLYMGILLDLLRSYQRINKIPSFPDFINQVIGKADVKGQNAPLKQRLAILESFISESDKNSDIRDHGGDIPSFVGNGVLIVVDLTDPLLSKSEVNSVFQVLVEQFRTCPLFGCGKMLALDEAHKFMDGRSDDGLSSAILDAVRLMRHDGMRVAISTQSPLAIRAEILELTSLSVLHRFQSIDWFNYLKQKIDLEEEDFQTLLGLNTGSAIVFAGKHMLGGNIGKGTFEMQIRPRLTKNRGSSRTNK
ncbi:hypothetical protein HDV01_003959 [Terramyces sp. JEL0728]|nr:hypothetical protein HDV01_003959 [Terramyces sp. JEL0728]